jgi:endonuclease III
MLAGLERLIRALEADLAEAEAAIREQVARHAPLQQTYDQLLSVPGSGPRLAVVVVGQVWRWDVLPHGQGTSKGLTAC